MSEEQKKTLRERLHDRDAGMRMRASKERQDEPVVAEIEPPAPMGVMESFKHMQVAYSTKRLLLSEMELKDGADALNAALEAQGWMNIDGVGQLWMHPKIRMSTIIPLHLDCVVTIAGLWERYPDRVPKERLTYEEIIVAQESELGPDYVQMGRDAYWNGEPRIPAQDVAPDLDATTSYVNGWDAAFDSDTTRDEKRSINEILFDAKKLALRQVPIDDLRVWLDTRVSDASDREAARQVIADDEKIKRMG